MQLDFYVSFDDISRSRGNGQQVCNTTTGHDCDQKSMTSLMRGHVQLLD